MYYNKTNKVKVIILEYEKIGKLQNIITEFINENPGINIISITGNSIQHDNITYILYEKKEPQQLQALNEDHKPSVNI